MRPLIIPFGIISIILLSCKKESALTSSAVKIKNGYFESVDSIKLSIFNVKKLNSGELSETIILNEGRHDCKHPTNPIFLFSY